MGNNVAYSVFRFGPFFPPKITPKPSLPAFSGFFTFSYCKRPGPRRTRTSPHNWIGTQRAYLCIIPPGPNHLVSTGKNRKTGKKSKLRPRLGGGFIIFHQLKPGNPWILLHIMKAQRMGFLTITKTLQKSERLNKIFDFESYDFFENFLKSTKNAPTNDLNKF